MLWPPEQDDAFDADAERRQKCCCAIWSLIGKKHLYILKCVLYIFGRFCDMVALTLLYFVIDCYILLHLLVDS